MAVERVVVDTKNKAKQFAELVMTHAEERKIMIYEIKSQADLNTAPMKRTWRMWMRETANWMAANGAVMPLMIKRDGTNHGSRPFNEQDAHELFTRQYLGVDASGERYKTATGDKGTMLSMMDRHLAWSTEKGISLTVPSDGEFQRLREETEGWLRSYEQGQ